MVVSFAHYICKAGTCKQEAAKLLQLQAQQRDAEQQARIQRAQEHRDRKEQRAAARAAGELSGDESAQDMEDSDVEVETEERAAAEADHKLLPAPALSQVIGDFVEAHLQVDDHVMRTLAQALQDKTHRAQSFDPLQPWHLSQVR